MFKMSTVLLPQLQPIITEKVFSNRARANKAIAEVQTLLSQGKLNTPGVVRNHAVAAESLATAQRWEGIARKVL